MSCVLGRTVAARKTIATWRNAAFGGGRVIKRRPESRRSARRWYTDRAFRADYKVNQAMSEANIFWSLTARAQYQEHTPRSRPHSS